MADDERWQVSSSAAQQYEQYVASFFAPWAEDLVQRAGLRAGWNVLDVACGTGIVTRAAGPLLGASGSIVGSDLNEEMLTEAARHKVEGAVVEWRQADATELPFGDGSFDAVLCQQGLQFVPDKAAAAAQMYRVLRDGGSAAVSVWCRPENNPYIAALADGLTRHLSAEAGASMLAPCGFGKLDDLAALFESAGFSAVEVATMEMLREPIDAVEAIEGNLAALPMSEEIRAMEAATYAAMIDDMVATLDAHIDGGVLHQPMAANIAIAAA